MDGRRTLEFANLGEMMAEVDRLLLGHKAVGRWSLGQVCNHLSATLRCAVEGYPSRAPWPIRKILGPIVRGVFWECTAVPDIRIQARTVAQEIARYLDAGASIRSLVCQSNYPE